MPSEHWVDHEFLLSATSRQRQMAQALGDHVSPGQWSFQGWTEVLRLLGDHLRYTPGDDAHAPEREPKHKADPESIAKADFFTDEYRLPGHRHEHGLLDEASRVLGLRSLLLDYYFGIDFEGDEAEEGADDEGDDDEAVDRQMDGTNKARPKAGLTPTRSLTDTEQRRGRRIAQQIIDTFASKPFIEVRPASMLSFDLAIAAVLLVSGHSERWLPDADFLDLTYRMWSFLFFDDGADEHGGSPNVGALARRHDESRDPHQFEESIGSVRLASSLATWCFCCPKNVSHAESARFQVATRLAVARLPWLWSLNDLEAVEKELFEIAQRTGWLGPDLAARWDDVHHEWNRMFAEGLALGQLEHVLLAYELPALRELVTDDVIQAGTLLWQGPKLGFCVLTQAANRQSHPRQIVPVLTVRSTKRDTRLASSFLLPFRSLLRLAREHAPGRVTESHVVALEDFADRLESALAKHG